MYGISLALQLDFYEYFQTLIFKYCYDSIVSYSTTLNNSVQPFYNNVISEIEGFNYYGRYYRDVYYRSLYRRNTTVRGFIPNERPIAIRLTIHDEEYVLLNNEIIPANSYDERIVSGIFRTCGIYITNGNIITYDTYNIEHKEQIESCPICLEKTMNENVYKLNCEHEFCGDCMKTYIKIKQNQDMMCSCPLCREIIKKISISENVIK